jgi:hypothetical protein
MALFLALMLAAPPSAEGHEQKNPLFRELREPGVALGAGFRSVLPPPSMPDGLDASAQRALLEKLAGDDYPLDELLRKSPVAPHIIKIHDIRPSDPAAPAYGVDVWFVAYGDLQTLGKKDVNSYFGSGRKEVNLRALTAEELAKHKLSPRKTADLQERYLRAVEVLLDKVQVELTSISAVSRTEESLLVATRLDQRFTGNPDLPNQWRKLERDETEDKVTLGPPHPYDCTATYLKITRLHEPKGALFVEYHRVSTEPKEWFGGANLLRSKLPILIQSEVRSFRREARKTLQED